MAFELYKGAGKQRRTKQYISVTANETFGLPRPFLDANEITEDMRVVLLYDQAARRVAIKFTDKAPDFSYKLRFSGGESSGAVIAAKEFFFDMKLDATKFRGRYYDFEKIRMAELGSNFSGVEGEAFVVTLKESPTSGVINDGHIGRPEGNINLDDIPF